LAENLAKPFCRNAGVGIGAAARGKSVQHRNWPLGPSGVRHMWKCATCRKTSNEATPSDHQGDVLQ